MNDNSYPPNQGQKPGEETGEETGPVELTDADIAEAISAAADNDGSSEKNEALEKEVSAMNDRLLRMAAELENTRRRADREKADASRYAIANFAHDLLAVADNFDRALQITKKDDASPSTETLSSLVAGLRMTETELLNVLERNGVTRINPAGEKFDPNLHQAVAQVPSRNIPTGHIVDVAQSGFTIGNRVLRAAMVTVSSGSAGAVDPDRDAGTHVDTEA